MLTHEMAIEEGLKRTLAQRISDDAGSKECPDGQRSSMYWRERVEEVLALTQDMIDLEARETLWRVAVLYEALAETAERRDAGLAMEAANDDAKSGFDSVYLNCPD